MRLVIKLLISLCIIILATQIGKKLPSLAGLIAVMPLTGLIVLVWLYYDNPGDFQLMNSYVKGALWGIIPSVLFFAAALLCFQKQLTLAVTLAISFAVWLIGAFVHQYLLGK